MSNIQNYNIPVSQIFADAVDENEWVPNHVSNTDGTLTLKQDEVLYENLSPQIIELIHDAFEKSGEDGYGPEHGFVLAYMNDGTIDFETLTSHAKGMIYDTDNDIALDALLDRVEQSSIQRMQYYHTHPSGSGLSMTLSRQDIGETQRLQERLSDLGINCPLDMHAMPYDLAYDTDYEQAVKPPLGAPPFDENGNFCPEMISKESTEPLPPTLIPVVPRIMRATLESEEQNLSL
ncbi:MAG: hypothetical protein ACRBCK_03885 [Alphaproteobacteria bacterium]